MRQNDDETPTKPTKKSFVESENEEKEYILKKAKMLIEYAAKKQNLFKSQKIPEPFDILTESKAFSNKTSSPSHNADKKANAQPPKTTDDEEEEEEEQPSVLASILEELKHLQLDWDALKRNDKSTRDAYNAVIEKYLSQLLEEHKEQQRRKQNMYRDFADNKTVRKPSRYPAYPPLEIDGKSPSKAEIMKLYFTTRVKSRNAQRKERLEALHIKQLRAMEVEKKQLENQVPPTPKTIDEFLKLPILTGVSEQKAPADKDDAVLLSLTEEEQRKVSVDLELERRRKQLNSREKKSRKMYELALKRRAQASKKLESDPMFLNVDPDLTQYLPPWLLQKHQQATQLSQQEVPTEPATSGEAEEPQFELQESAPESGDSSFFLTEPQDIGENQIEEIIERDDSLVYTYSPLYSRDNMDSKAMSEFRRRAFLTPLRIPPSLKPSLKPASPAKTKLRPLPSKSLLLEHDKFLAKALGATTVQQFLSDPSTTQKHEKPVNPGSPAPIQLTNIQSPQQLSSAAPPVSSPVVEQNEPLKQLERLEERLKRRAEEKKKKLRNGLVTPDNTKDQPKRLIVITRRNTPSPGPSVFHLTGSFRMEDYVTHLHLQKHQAAASGHTKPLSAIIAQLHNNTAPQVISKENLLQRLSESPQKQGTAESPSKLPAIAPKSVPVQ